MKNIDLNLIVHKRSNSKINYFFRHLVEIYCSKIYLDILRFISYRTPEGQIISKIKTHKNIDENLPYNISSIKKSIKILKDLNIVIKTKTTSRSGYAVNPFYLSTNPFKSNQLIFNYYELSKPELFNENDPLRENRDFPVPHIKTYKMIYEEIIKLEKSDLLNTYKDINNIPSNFFDCNIFDESKESAFYNNKIKIVKNKKEFNKLTFYNVDKFLDFQIEEWIEKKILIRTTSTTEFLVNTISNKGNRKKK